MQLARLRSIGFVICHAGNSICVNVLTEIVTNLHPEEEDDDTESYCEENENKPAKRLRRLNQHVDETAVP